MYTSPQLKQLKKKKLLKWFLLAARTEISDLSCKMLKFVFLAYTSPMNVRIVYSTNSLASLLGCQIGFSNLTGPKANLWFPCPILAPPTILGVIVDASRPLTFPTLATSKSCCLCLQNIFSIWWFFITSTTTNLAQVTIISHLDYCGGLLIGLSASILALKQSL